jgi:hypothetical protein
MLHLVALFGVLITLACAWGVADPQGLVKAVDRFSGIGGFLIAIIVRIILGTAAILAAPVSRLPIFLYIIGGVSLIAALALVIMGKQRFGRLILWVAAWPSPLLRTGLVLGMLFGVAMVWVTGIV